ncbi:MAG: hypothetical protein L6Q35_01640 [Phycisphaerales bacterium]|nr:hypothetical protein [Phycisphaerales bacterium]
MNLARVHPRAAAALLLTCALAGCVTENAPRPTRTSTTGATLPEGPIAAPARAVSITSRVLIGLRPVGRIAYDGHVLPLTSPDGRFCAVQEGDPPTWSTLLAAPDSQPPLGNTLAVYDLSTSPPTRLGSSLSAESGLLLGRAADHRGFLVESVRPTGARWIGLASWQAGNIQWLASDEAVSAHGMLTPEGLLVYTRRPIDGTRADLVVKSPSGAVDVRSDSSRPYAMPLATQDPATIYTLLLTESGIELQAIGLSTRGDAAKFGPVLARRLISSARDIATAYQVAAPFQAPFPAGPAAPGPIVDDGVLAIFSPLLGRMAAFDVRTGALMPLAPSSIAAVPWSSASRPGFLCTTPGGLVFVPQPEPGKVDSAPEAKVLAESYIVRRTTDQATPALLFGPVRSDPRLLEIVGVSPADPDAE